MRPVLIVVGSLLLAGCTSAPVSPALSPQEAEETFLAMIEIAGVKLPGTDLSIGGQHALRVGHGMCTALSESDLPPQVIGLAAQEAGGFSAGDAGALMGAAVGSLCPEHRDRLAA